MVDNINVCENVLLFAFRYAIEQTTGASNIIVREMLLNWELLSNEFKLQVVLDIKSKKKFCTCLISYKEPYDKANSKFWLDKIYPTWEAILIKADKEDL